MTKVESVIRDIIGRYIAGKELLLFDDWMQVAKIYYDHFGWYTVPMVLRVEDGKIKKRPAGRWKWIEKACSWEDIEKIWKSVGKGRKIDETLITGIAIYCGKKSGITIIDIDDIQKFEISTGLKIDNLSKGTYAQRSLKGVHLFYRYLPDIESMHLKELGFEVRNNGLLTNLYPSYVPKEGENKDVEIVRYEPMNYHNIAEVPTELLKILTKNKKKFKRKEERTGKKVLLSFDRKSTERIMEIAPLIKELYQEGKLEGWWDIDCSFVGGLVHLGITDEDIHLVLQEIYGDEYSEKESQYVIDRAKDGEENVRGLGSFILKLKELAEEDKRAREVLEFLSPKLEPLGYGFARIGSMLLRANGNGELRPVGPYLELESVLHGEEDGETYYMLSYVEKSFPMKLGDDRTVQSTIEGHTGVPIVEKKAMKEYLLRLVNMAPPKKVYRKRTGWYGEEFRYPLNAEKDEVWDLIQMDKFRIGGEKEEHRKLVEEVLYSGSELSVLYVASLSTPLLYPLGLNPFLVHISGPHGTGKTTAGMSACSLWYYARDYITLFGTRNAIELILSKLCDLPVLLDEEELTRDTEMVQTLAYMLFSGKGKGRANVKLEVRQREVRSVVFTTSEHSLEDTVYFSAGKNPIQKLGALRRTLHVGISDREEFWKGLDFKKVESATKKVYGHFGLEWIKFISNKEKIQRAYSKASKEKITDGSEHIFLALWTTYHLLCEFYGVKEINSLRELIGKYVQQQEKLLHEDWNLLKRFGEEFSAWIAGEKDHFYFYGEVSEPKSPIYGKVENEKVYIITSYFRQFCANKGFSERVILEELERKGLLITTGTGKRTMKKIAGSTVSTYAINLGELVNGESISFLGEQDRNVIESAIRTFEEQGIVKVEGVEKSILEEIEIRLMENSNVDTQRIGNSVVFRKRN